MNQNNDNTADAFGAQDPSPGSGHTGAQDPSPKSGHTDALSKNEDLNKQFHPAFCDAMTQIFEHDRLEYTYAREYNLNSMPNRIDFLISKKGEELDDSLESDHEMGKIFRRHNIFEYKSPDQGLSVNDYYTAMAYAYLYASKIPGITIDDITVSFVREGMPQKLMLYFEENGFDIVCYGNGIFHVRKEGHVDMQVIVTRDLDDKYIWLKALSDKLGIEDARKLALAAKTETDEAGQTRIRSILDLVSRLNENKDWIKEMANMGAFRDLFKEEFEERDRKIQDLSEQLQTQNEQIQDQGKQLKRKEEELTEKNNEVNSLKKEIDRLKEQLKNSRIAMF